MRTWLTPLAAVFVLALAASEATGQGVAYINFMQFDLQSFRSQATAGIFPDDVDAIGNSAKLGAVEGNRLFTSFSNLGQPATLGDNLLTYSVDRQGSPSQSNLFDGGSYLLGWMGKYREDSAYRFELFYQRNGSKTMFEDLEDGALGQLGDVALNDAEFTGWTRTTTHVDSTGAVAADSTASYDLLRYDRRSAMNFDFGVSRDLSEDLTAGGRIFAEDDRLDSYSEGTAEIETRVRSGAGGMVSTGRQRTVYSGTGEDAFKSREFGISLDADYHPWDNQNVNLRLDVFGARLVNPASNLTPANELGRAPGGAFDPVGARVNLREDFVFQRQAAGSTTNPGGFALEQARENLTSATTSAYPNGLDEVGAGSDYAIADVDDTRLGFGYGLKFEWGREAFRGWNEAWVGFSDRDVDIDSDVVRVNREYSTFWWNAGAGDRRATLTNFDDTITTNRLGETTHRTFEAGSRWKRDLNRTLSVGLGFIYTQTTWTDDYVQSQSQVRIENKFDDGDGTTNALNAATNDPAHAEVETVLESTLREVVIDESRNRFFRLPVGAQFHFRDRWTINLGAQHTIAHWKRDTSFDVPADGNGLTRRTERNFGAGTEVVSFDAAPGAGLERGTDTVDRAETSATTYWYGLSVRITDAAQLDVNGFFDTYRGDGDGETESGDIFDVDFFRNLAISLKYIFW